jgi:hypothetical protein
VDTFADDRELLERLVQLPGETLNVEIKAWLDPTQAVDAAKIIKACFALRNRNGGHLLIGFQDRSLQPDTGREPADIRRLFHVDDLQALISRHASTLFEVRVEFVERDGTPYPVIIVPSGVKVPVAAKADLVDAASGTRLIAQGEVYFRTLRANGVASSSTARSEDWADIIDICIGNQEGDLARFLRRYFPGAELAAALGAMGAAASTPPSPGLRQRAEDLLQQARERFEHALAERDDG